MQHDEINPLWHLHEELSITQAAALVAGYDPEELSMCANDTNFGVNFRGFVAAKSAIKNALITGKVRGKITPIYDYDINGNVCDEFPDSANPDDSRVEVESLVAWLQLRRFTKGFFFPVTDSETPGYLNPDHPRFSAKLAATVRAWEAVTSEGGQHPKQAITAWLNRHAAEFGMTDNDGMPVKQAIEDCAKVANWKPSGGAPTTPGE